MLRKPLSVIGLTLLITLTSTADSPRPTALIQAMESAYDHPQLFFTAKTEEIESAVDSTEPVRMVIEQRYCRDGKKLDVTARRESSAEAVPGRIDRYVITPTSRIGLRMDDQENATPMIMRKTPDQEARDFARSLLHGGQALDGYLASDLEPLPAVLRSAKKVSVRPASELVGDTPCVVVDATSKSGRYTVWVDEKDGATVRKADVVKHNGDQYNSLKKLGALKIDGTPVAQTRFTMDNVVVETIQGKTVPVRATLQTTYTLTDGRTQTVRQDHTRASLDLAPDFDGLDAFRMRIPKDAIGTDALAVR